jgi:transcription termination/antitermination protein NusG
MSDLKWYVLRVVSGQEKKVKTYLEKEVSIQKLEEYIAQLLTPSEKVYQVRKMKDGKSKKIAVERNLLPGYVMLNANLRNGEVLHTILSVPGVLGFLDYDKNVPGTLPKPMRDSDVSRILGKVEETDEHEVKHDITFHIGETVKVMNGPFNGFSGTVEEIFDEKKKLKVMVKIFGRNAPVELNYIEVSKEE